MLVAVYEDASFGCNSSYAMSWLLLRHLLASLMTDEQLWLLQV